MKFIDFELSITAAVSGHEGEGTIFVLPTGQKDQWTGVSVLKHVSPNHQDTIAKVLKKRAFDFKAGSSLSCDFAGDQKLGLLLVDEDVGMFGWLTSARQLVGTVVLEAKVKHLVLDLRACRSLAPELADAFVSAIAAGMYKFPKYEGKKLDRDGQLEKAKKSSKSDLQKLTIVVDKSQIKSTDTRARQALLITSAGTNLVRWLAKRAGNDLTCKTYVSYLKKMAAERRWKFEHINHSMLESMGAGAFLAVVRGSDHQDYGIVKLTYAPPKAQKHCVLVGKGLVFDTGGHNLKTSHMLGMHGDMGGSAVALATLNVATLEKWPSKVTAYLAVADNMIGPKAYKPNDIITALNGTTIEIIDTDAEGRMVLADTLTLASRERPDLLMDFATLTGACLRAIGTTFSGVFSNRRNLTQALIDAGYEVGERVWPFPMDKDFAECLESTSADIKQCREKGGVDHIEASQFLMGFAGKETPWVHVDRSAFENTGGLAHVATNETGFGVRFASEFARKFLKI
ncbi:MAG: leucyl aminopeptidase family protein [Proteobacteria bacterium]|nr:leucyl aminopeptidase family protein [Pseudomonadota bacterium]